VLAETEFIGVRGENPLFFQPSTNLPLEKVPVNPRRKVRMGIAFTSGAW
jgi:hypothetical protein